MEIDLICGSLDVFAAAIIGILLFGTLLRETHPRPFGKKIITMLLCHMIGLLSDSIIWFWNPVLFPNIDIAVAVMVQKVAATVSYAVLIYLTIIYTDCLVKFIGEKASVSKKIVPSIVALCFVAGIFWIISIFNGMFFTFDADGRFVSTQLYWVSHGLVSLFLGVDMVLILKHYKTLGRRNALPLLSYIALPVLGFSISYQWDVTPAYLATTLSMLLMFVVFYLEQDKQMQEQERQLTQSRISIMISQIQPHFLYNSLNSIHRLCVIDPKSAQRAIAEFSDYLRGNLESLNQAQAISFAKELEHIKCYLNLEKMRFGDKLTIVYDIKTDEFRLPALTVQPLVENAVKHGVSKAENGGTVTIATQEQEDCFEIVITDNGIGFDVNAVQQDNRTHIGIDNVKKRIEVMCHGVLTITSQQGVGTVAIIRLPKEK